MNYSLPTPQHLRTVLLYIIYFQQLSIKNLTHVFSRPRTLNEEEKPKQYVKIIKRKNVFVTTSRLHEDEKSKDIMMK